MIELSRAECRFFQRLAHRLGTDRIDQAQDNHLVGEQPQGPVAPATGRIGTRQFDQLLFNVPFNFDLVGSGRPWLGVKGRLDASVNCTNLRKIYA